MNSREVRIQLLLGKRVLSLNGRPIGRLEEIRGEPRKGECYVTEFLIGRYAFFERIAALNIGRAILHVLGLRGESDGYLVPWDKLDLRDPEHPRLLCKVSELSPFEKS